MANGMVIGQFPRYQYSLGFAFRDVRRSLIKRTFGSLVIVTVLFLMLTDPSESANPRRNQRRLSGDASSSQFIFTGWWDVTSVLASPRQETWNQKNTSEKYEFHLNAP